MDETFTLEEIEIEKDEYMGICSGNDEKATITGFMYFLKDYLINKKRGNDDE